MLTMSHHFLFLLVLLLFFLPFCSKYFVLIISSHIHLSSPLLFRRHGSRALWRVAFTQKKFQYERDSQATETGQETANLDESGKQFGSQDGARKTLSQSPKRHVPCPQTTTKVYSHKRACSLKIS